MVLRTGTETAYR